MYTITRKIAMVCLAVVFSVLVYGCSGGDSQQASTPSTPSTDSPDTPTTVDMDMVSDGLTITAGTFTIQPGSTATLGDVTYTCPDGEACMVEVDDEGAATSAGGAATAMNSAAGQTKADEAAELVEKARLEEERLAKLRAVMNDVNTDLVLTGLTITPGLYPIAPGETAEAGDATLRCLSGEVACNVTVAPDGTVKSVGGAATVTLSIEGIVTLHTVREVKIVLKPRYVKIPESKTTVQPNRYLEIGDVKIKCTEGGVRCIVAVDDEGTVTSTGGLATIEGYSTEAIETRTAIALFSPDSDDAASGTLVAQASCRARRISF